MKILRLRLSNLASLSGEQDISFESEPLAQAGLIAITGKTGSGKSTLLDAMCLALFDQIPRLTGATGSITDASGQDLALKDSKHILRRGCLNGYAEVEFLGLDQKHYIARWEIRRTRNKLDGNLKLDRSVKCIDDGRVLTQKISECTPCVQQLIGLNFGQFTRAVLLAQSEVGAFLKAKDQERSDILEHLTNSYIFRKIGQASFEKTKQFNQELSKIQSILGHISVLSEEEVYSLEQNKIDLTQQHAREHTTLKQLEQAENWYAQSHHLQQQLNIQKQNLDDLQQQKSDIQLKQTKVDQLQQFQEVRHIFQGIEDAQNNQNQLEAQYKQLSTQDLEHAYLQANEIHQIITKNLKQEETNQKDLQPFLQQAFTFDTRREQLLEDYQQKQIEIKHAQSQLNELTRKIQDDQYRLNQLITETKTLQQSAQHPFFEEPNATIDKLNTYIQLQNETEHSNPQHAYAQLEARWGQLTQLEEKVKQQENEIRQKQSQKHYADILKRSLEHYLNSLEEQNLKQNELKKAEQNLQHLQQTRQEKQRAYQESLIHSEQVEHLRQQLTPEHPCMVCGSHQHPFSDTKPEIQHQENITLNELEAIKAQILACEITIQTYKKTNTEDKINHAYQQLCDDLMPSGFVLNLQSTDLLSPFEAQYQTLCDTLFTLQESEKECRKELQLYQAITRQKLEYEKIQHIEAFLNAKYPQQWSVMLAENMLIELQQITVHKQQLQQNTIQIQNLKQTLEPLLKKIDVLKTQLETHETQLEHIKLLGTQNKVALEDIIQKHSEQSFTTAHSWANFLAEKKQALQDEEQQASTTLQTLQKDYLQQKQQLQDIKTKQQMWQTQCETYQQTFETWQKQHPHFDDVLISDCRTYHYDDLKRLQDEIKTFNQYDQELQLEVKNLENQIVQLHQTTPVWTLEQTKEHIAQKKQLIQQIHHQQSEVQSHLMTHANAKKQQLQYQTQIDQLQHEVNRWGKISKLIGSSDGASFTRIAQEHHLDILIEYANQQLQPLAPRYQLQRIQNSLGLAVIDHDMNGEKRPVQSLSGGETFLVSLALALAIANMSAGSIKLESLFIDEGFGTLDPTSLHMVMDALDRLQSQGRKIVLISHVQEMHERIPVQIQVKATNAGASTIEVVG